MSENIYQMKNLDEFTKCYICLGKLVDATMCPNCQKLSCQKCIQKWIIERKTQCPHCRTSLKLNQIINVRFLNELSHIIDTLKITKEKSLQEKCPDHNITLLYFCMKCNQSLCSDCYMFGSEHKDHEINKLENVYINHRDLIKNESKELKNKCDRLNNYLRLLNEKIIFVRNYKTERSIELDEVFDKMKNKLENLMHEKLTKLINSKNTILDRLKFLDDIKNTIESELNEAPKSELISKSESLIKNLKNIENEEDIRSDILNISLDLPSDIYPPYDYAYFVVKDYKKLIQTQKQNLNLNDISSNSNNDVIYSDDLKTNGLIWRLKFYPNGNGAVKGEYISVFLELRDGLLEPMKYFYRIELENFFKDDNNNHLQGNNIVGNFNGNKSNFWKEFSSDFQKGECWGYNKFYRIENLEKDGFIDESGRLVFKFFVRPQNYVHLCKDQKNYIRTLEKKNQMLQEQVNFYINQKIANDPINSEANIMPSEENNCNSNSNNIHNYQDGLQDCKNDENIKVKNDINNNSVELNKVKEEERNLNIFKDDVLNKNSNKKDFIDLNIIKNLNINGKEISEFDKNLADGINKENFDNDIKNKFTNFNNCVINLQNKDSKGIIFINDEDINLDNNITKIESKNNKENHDIDKHHKIDNDRLMKKLRDGILISANGNNTKVSEKRINTLNINSSQLNKDNSVVNKLIPMKKLDCGTIVKNRNNSINQNVNSQRDKINNNKININNNSINFNDNQGYNFNYGTDSYNNINSNTKYNKNTNSSLVTDSNIHLSNLNFNYKNIENPSIILNSLAKYNETNIYKGKLSKNSTSINLEFNNKLSNENIGNKYSLDIENFQSNLNKETLTNSESNTFQLNNIRRNSLSIVNENKKDVGLNISNSNMNMNDFEISADIKEELKNLNRDYFLNNSEIKLSRNGNDEINDNDNINPWVSVAKSDNIDIENEHIMITEINYKDLINKKVKNKLLKCEKLLNEIKVREEVLNTNNKKFNFHSPLNKKGSSEGKIKQNDNDFLNQDFKKNAKNFLLDLSQNNSQENNNNHNTNIDEKILPVDKADNMNLNHNILEQNNSMSSGCSSLGSLMESMKMMDDNSFYDQHILNLQKIKRASDIFEDQAVNKIKGNKELKNKNVKEEKSNRERFSDIFNIYGENIINRQPSPIGCNQNKKNNEKIKDNINSEAFNEKLKKLISKKKK